MAWSQAELDYFSQILGMPITSEMALGTYDSLPQMAPSTSDTMLDYEWLKENGSPYVGYGFGDRGVPIDPKTGMPVTRLTDQYQAGTTDILDPSRVQYDPTLGLYTDPGNMREYEGDWLSQYGWALPLAAFGGIAALTGGTGTFGAGAATSGAGGLTGAGSAADAAAWGGWTEGAGGLTGAEGLTTAGMGYGAETIPGYASMSASQQAAFNGLVSTGVPTGTAMEAVMAAGSTGGGGWLSSLGLGDLFTGSSVLNAGGSALSGLGSYGGLASAGLGALAGVSGPQSGTTTTTSGPPEWLQTQLQGYLGNANQVAANSQYVPMNGYQTDALQGIANQAMAGSPANASGQQQISDTLDGYYLNSNPYLDYNINKAQNDLVQQYQLGTAAQTDASAARAHALGGSSYNQLTAYNNNVLANNLNNVDASMRGTNYANERGNQMQALSQTPNMINAGYADFNNLYNAGNTLQQQQQTQAQWPEHQLGIQDNAMKTALGGAGSVQSTPWQANTTAGLLGGAATGLSLWNQWSK